MRIVAIAAVKNEADIIEAFVRHTLTAVQRLVVLDNGSLDGTLHILQSLRNEGLALDIVEDPSLGQRQAERKTMLLREHAIRKHAADWVLPLDADEFVVSGSAKLVTAETPTDAPIALPWRTYVPVASDSLSEPNPILRIRNRLRKENWAWFKVMVPSKLAAQSEAHLMPGNHEFRIGETICEPAPASNVLLAHFPIRSISQYLVKVAIGHLQYRVVPDRPGDWGWHYRQVFERLKDDPAEIAQGLTQAACRYACPDHVAICTETSLDPVEYVGKPLRYTHKCDEHWRPLQVVAAHAEALASRYAALTAGLDARGNFSEEHFAETLEALHKKLALQDDMLREGGAASILRDEQFHHLSARVEAQFAVLAERDRELHRLNGQVEGLTKAFDHARQQTSLLMDAYRAAQKSWTWRSGRLIVGPAELVRKAVRAARFAKKKQADSPSPESTRSS